MDDNFHPVYMPRDAEIHRYYYFYELWNSDKIRFANGLVYPNYHKIFHFFKTRMYNVNCLALIISGELCHWLRCMSSKKLNVIGSCSVFGICNICIWGKKKKGKASKRHCHLSPISM